MREIIKLSVRLMAFALVSALMLAVVNALTKERIATNESKKVNAARIAVLGDYDFEEVQPDLTGTSYIKRVFAATEGGAAKGYVYELESIGFAGPVSLSVGIDAGGTVTGVAIASHTETKGLGTDQQAPFLAGFVGLSAASAEAPNAGTAPAETPEADATTGATADGATGATATATPAAEGTADAATGATADGATGATATATPAAEGTADAATGATTDGATGATAESTAAAEATTGATTDGTTSASPVTELSGAAATGAVAGVDGMTGATYSTNAVKNAVAEALSHFAANYLGGGAAQ